MQSITKFLFLLLFISISVHSFAQVKTVRRYTPPGSSMVPQTYSETSESTPDAAMRRTAALSKVQGTPSKKLTAKGIAPSQYSTDGVAPAEYSVSSTPSTTFTVNGTNMERNVRKGQGQVGDLVFTPISELHYVQFAVYCKDTPVDKAPAVEGLMLLWHEGSKCPGGAAGACYIVKGYNSVDEAKSAVNRYKSERIDCWYNPALTGAAVEVIGVRS